MPCGRRCPLSIHRLLSKSDGEEVLNRLNECEFHWYTIRQGRRVQPPRSANLTSHSQTSLMPQ